MTYERLKALFWPHITLSLALLILIDYITMIGVIVQLVAGAYLGLHLIAFVVGFIAGAIGHIDSRSAWSDLFNYNIAKFFPLLPAGRDWFAYLMTEREPKDAADDDKDSDRGDDGEPGARRKTRAAEKEPSKPIRFIEDEED